ncbi:Zinc finger C2H2, partial [Penicillium longicatenatum]
YIKGELRVKIGLSTAEMNKDGVSLNDLTILMTQLWCRDYYEYRGNPVDRIRETDKDSVDCDLEARVLAAYYKYFILIIEIVNGMPMLVLTYEREL